MRRPIPVVATAAICAFAYAAQPLAAAEGAARAAAAADATSTLEEVIVTARKREESLQDVPVSISVLNDQTLAEAGVYSQRDLFEQTPSMHYDVMIDRNSQLSSVRGVGSNEAATNKTKVSAFIDGMPVLGSQGTLQLKGVRQVEFYRGPQSAAFGRSTFGGAINYITKDPTSSLSGTIDGDFNDYGRRVLNGSVSGPITGTLGYIVNGTYEDSTSPNSYVASDGTRYGTQATKSVDGKLVFKPTDKLVAKLRTSYISTHDGPPVAFFISQAARDACYDGTYRAGLGGGLWANGTLDCDWSQGHQIQTQNDRSALLIKNGVTDPNILFLAQANSIPRDRIGSFDKKNRTSLQLSYDFDNKSTLDVSGFYGLERYFRSNDASQTSTTPISITAPVTTGTMTNPYYVVNTAMGAVVGDIMSDPTFIEEKYVEARWSSPSANRLRYLLGASYYNYYFNTNIYTQGFGAFLQGPDAIARYSTLTGFGQPGGSTVNIGVPNQLFAEKTTNLGAFFSASYDVTDKLTGSLEGRYASDEVGGFYPGITYLGVAYDARNTSVTTKRFLPRVSLNYNWTADTTFYAQASKGNNPASINSGFLSPAIIDTLTRGPTLNGVTYVSYGPTTFLVAKEETLTNYEIGMKGNALNRRLSYSVALYLNKWENATQTINLGWDNPANLGAPAANTTNRTAVGMGDINLKGIELEGNYLVTNNWSVHAALGYLDAKYASNYCDPSLSNTNLDLIDPSRLQLRVNSPRVVAGAQRIRTDYDCYNTSGLTLMRQPPLSATVSPSYKAKLGNTDWNWTARADVHYEDGIYIDAANVAKLPSVRTMNLSLGLMAKVWTATAYVNNVTGNDTPTNVIGPTDYTITSNTLRQPTNTLAVPLGATYSQANYLVNPRMPRTFGLRVARNF